VLVILAAVDFGAWGGDVVRIALLIALFGWIGAARLARGAALSVLRQDFVRAAVAVGVPGPRIALRHVAPMVAGPIVVAATLGVAGAILTESVLSFLGLGIRPPTPSWGAMLANAQEMVFSAPLLALWPGLCIAAAVLACNLLGDGLARRLRG
jgi:peptide/nickel transport system permease protein